MCLGSIYSRAKTLLQKKIKALAQKKNNFLANTALRSFIFSQINLPILLNHNYSKPSFAIFLIKTWTSNVFYDTIFI